MHLKMLMYSISGLPLPVSCLPICDAGCSAVPWLLPPTQAIERNERGRRVQGRGRGRHTQPQYFRLLRPTTGYADSDIDREVRMNQNC